jgi:purine nucleosidase
MQLTAMSLLSQRLTREVFSLARHLHYFFGTLKMHLRHIKYFVIIILSLVFLSNKALCDTPKIIVDVDLAHYADDHEALVMLATLHKRKKIELLGVTLVTGNHWMEQIEVDTLKAMERLDLANKIPVFRGAEKPLLHSQEIFNNHDKALYGAIYAGAWKRERVIKIPPDGTAINAKIQSEHAVNFIIDTIRANPGKVTIAALGPLTNLAMAIRMAPDIVDDIKEIIYMGGAFFVWGNVTTAAEFNWWFDAEAAAIVLAEPVKHIIIPLDATDRILFNKNLYDQWALKAHQQHFMITQFLQPKFGKKFKHDPDYTLPVWDALVAAYISDPTVAIDKQTYWVGVDTTHGANYGRAIAAPVKSDVSFITPFQPASSQKADVVLQMDESRFWQIYEDLLFSTENLEKH